jgi:GT2 family glycosyltransferase
LSPRVRSVGVINVLYNNRDNDLRQYYRELRRQFDGAPVGCKTFVIDNSEREQRHLVPQDCVYRHFPENLGYTRACNLLMAEAFAAGCDAVITTNVDGFFLPGCVAGMLATLARHGGDALVEARQFPQEHPRPYDPLTGATDWVSGCCLLIGRRTYEQLGPFDENMFLYCEDVDYSYRARLAGIPCVVSSGAHFYHRHRRPLEEPKRKHHLLSARYLAAKWRSPTTQTLMEEALVREGFFASADDLPALPADMQTYPGIHWEPTSRLTFAQTRWET